MPFAVTMLSLLLLTITLIYSVQYLETYDAEHATEYAEKAKAVFFQVAKAVVQADEREQSRETITLLNFKEILYS